MIKSLAFLGMLCSCLVAADVAQADELGQLGIVGVGNGEIRNEKRHGRWVFTSEGRIVGKIDYKDGVMHGLWIAFDHDGAVLCFGLFFNGQMSGRWLKRKRSDDDFRDIIFPQSYDESLNEAKEAAVAEYEAILKEYLESKEQHRIEGGSLGGDK